MVFTVSGERKAEEAKSERQAESKVGAFSMLLYRLRQTLTQPRTYVGLLGVLSMLLLWYVLTEMFNIPRFNKLPGPISVWKEFTSRTPTYGISIYTPEYYMHIFWSVWRVAQAFFWATILGVPLGLFMGWRKVFRDYTFPILEIIRPIPVLAWVPIAILLFTGIASREAPIIFLTFLAAFYATVLNTMLGVESIDEVYFRAVSVQNPATSFFGSFCRARYLSFSPDFRSVSEWGGFRWSRQKCFRANMASAS